MADDRDSHAAYNEHSKVVADSAHVAGEQFVRWESEKLATAERSLYRRRLRYRLAEEA